ncbi:spermidine/putrescine ABC transporter substrate-binding protein [Sorangium sp. So ce1036]|uniref:polyamine ABC transporter substrate-binding protein n=1 Tax=Sorangium sp. So ce1036 TaxID=3133328 RepID=UPI003F129947
MKRISALLILLCIPVMVLLGCGKKESPAPAGAARGDGAAAPGPKAGGELDLFAWSEYVPQEVLDAFTKETGIKVNYETYASNEEMMSKLLAGGARYDLIQPSEYAVEALIKKNKLLPLDHARLPNLKNIAPEFRGQAHDPELKYTVPYMGTTVGIVVNTERVKEPVRGYKDVFQPKHKGRIVVLNDARELVAWALATQGLKPDDVTPENLAKIKPILAGWIKLVKVFDSDSPKTALLNGDVDLGIVWSGEAALLHQADKEKFKFVLPAEGTHRSIDSLAIPAGAENKVGAEMFMNYILRPEVSKLISDKFPYTNPNAEARKLLTPEQLANPASYPPLEGMTTFHDIGKAAADVDELVTDLKASQ